MALRFLNARRMIGMLIAQNRLSERQGMETGDWGFPNCGLRKVSEP